MTTFSHQTAEQFLQASLTVSVLMSLSLMTTTTTITTTKPYDTERSTASPLSRICCVGRHHPFQNTHDETKASLSDALDVSGAFSTTTIRNDHSVSQFTSIPAPHLHIQGLFFRTSQQYILIQTYLFRHRDLFGGVHERTASMGASIYALLGAKGR